MNIFLGESQGYYRTSEPGSMEILNEFIVDDMVNIFAIIEPGFVYKIPSLTFLVRHLNVVQILSILLYRETFFRRIILWHVDPLLGNDHDISSYATTIAR
jgi:hypothetical protein